MDGHCIRRGGGFLEIYSFDTIPWPYLKGKTRYPHDASEFDARKAHALWEAHFRFWERVEAAGLDGIGLNEHHGTHFGSMPTPGVYAAHIAARTKRAKIAILGYCLPLYPQPLRVAEEIAALDVLSGGRIVAGFLRGAHREYLAYNVDPAESRGRFQEAWEFILKAWSEPDPFDWEGEYFHYPRCQLWTRPWQQPHPPILFPADSEASLDWGARMRTPVVLSHRPFNDLLKKAAYYRERCRAHGWEAGAEHVWLEHQVYVADSRSQALDEAGPALSYYWRNLYGAQPEILAELKRRFPGSLPAPKPSSPETEVARGKPLGLLGEEARTPAQLMNDGMAAVGAADEVRDELITQKEQMGFGGMVIYFHFGNLSVEKAASSMEKFAQDVMPTLKSA